MGSGRGQQFDGLQEDLGKEADAEVERVLEIRHLAERVEIEGRTR